YGRPRVDRRRRTPPSRGPLEGDVRARRLQRLPHGGRSGAGDAPVGGRRRGRAAPGRRDGRDRRRRRRAPGGCRRALGRGAARLRRRSTRRLQAPRSRRRGAIAAADGDGEARPARARRMGEGLRSRWSSTSPRSRRSCARPCAPSLVRAHVERVVAGEPSDTGRDLWDTFVGLDWQALTIDEAHGGVGFGFPELAVMAEELGRVIAPGPLLTTVAGLVPLLREADGGDSWLARVAAGELSGTVA